MADFVSFIFELIRENGAWAVFLGVLVEEIIVPIPSPLILMGSGFLLIDPSLTFAEALPMMFYQIAIPAAVAGTLGSFFVYAIGYYGGKPVIKRFEKWLDADWDKLERTSERMSRGKNVWLTIFLMRAVVIFPMSLVALVSGLLRLSWKKYAVATFFGSVPRAMILAFLGWKLGAGYVRIAETLSATETLILMGFAIAAAIFLYKHRKHITKGLTE
jgi:membrane protein DedA with SNARE-associated domain